MKTKDYHFKVMDLDKTRENHLGKLKKYREYIKDPDNVPFNYKKVENYYYEREYNPTEVAEELYSNMPYYEIKYLSSWKTVRSVVNNFFRQNIRFYLERYDLPTSWDTAVYLHTYKGFNTFMNKVANQLQKIIDNENKTRYTR